MSLVLLYDVRVVEGSDLVLTAKGVRGAAEAHVLIAEFYRRKRAPGATPDHHATVTCRRVEGRSLHESRAAA